MSSSLATSSVHVTLPSANVPPFSALTNSVNSGISSVIVTVASLPVVFLYLIWYVRLSPTLTGLPSILVVVSPSVKTSFSGCVGVGLMTSFVSLSLTPSSTLALLMSFSPLTSSSTVTTKLTVRLSSYSTSMPVHVIVLVASSYVPPLSALLNVVCSGIVSVTVTVVFSPVVFL